ncbi:DNA polymerase-3 subunit epsilon [Breoghania corrubedonensis]|uniref:DNA polymerase III subunit epsilon n=1 Tax=Breoghania corrubedonensis TaxID=665038 RepID=A0A2T5VHQ1_9HYPH|nr:DNA polymerase III subunit epsilon [Breoghania corrubedonensis]PTW63256.1 DNA polymerase-3 subunit epsilon [Breoghania corrubedonensis]
MREIVLDTETTGLNPRGGDRLVEIGGVELVNHIPSGQSYHVYINPERDMPEEAFNVHGLSEEFLRDKPLFADLARDFVDYVGDATLVIHNAAFDMGFINMELQRFGLPPIGNEQVLDTLQLARRRHPAGPNSLDALCSRYGIDNSRRTKHGALLDAELLAEVYIELIGGKQSSLGLMTINEEEDHGTGGPAIRHSIKPRPTPLPSRLSEAEISAHAKFVAKIGDEAVWRQYIEIDELS